MCVCRCVCVCTCTCTCMYHCVCILQEMQTVSSGMSLLHYLKTSFSMTCKYSLVVYSNLKVTNTWYMVHVQYVCVGGYCTQVLFDFFLFCCGVGCDRDQLHVHAHMYSTFCAVLSHVEHFYKSTVHVPS